MKFRLLRSAWLVLVPVCAALTLGATATACGSGRDRALDRKASTGANNPNGNGGEAAFAADADAAAAPFVHTTRVIIGPGADDSTPKAFGGATSNDAGPSWAYPSDGILVPPNMNELELQWVPGAGGQKIFELTFSSKALDLKIYMTCQTLGAGCSYAPTPGVWSLLQNGGRDDEYVYTIRATSAAGAPVVKSAEQRWAFAKEDLLGGIYYWNAGGGQTKRYEFGVSGQKAETFLSPANAGAAFCVGCHVLSRDGRFIAVGLDFPAGTFKTISVGNRQQVYAQTGASFFAFSPDSSTMMTSGGLDITWRNTNDGSVRGTPVPKGTMPDWSPDGNQMVYVRSDDPVPIANPGVSAGSLDVLPWNGSAWGNIRSLVARQGGENNYYPTFSPDSAWVLFNRSPSGINSFGESDSSGSGQGSSGVRDGQLWIVNAQGGTPRRLDRASVPTDSYDSWPKWATITQSYRGHRVMWFTFSSKRAYGLRVAEGERTQLWMAGFDADAAVAGQDPSFTAFWLPFQEIDSGNHIAQWVTRVERQLCGADNECGQAEKCEAGRCIPQIK